MPLRAAQLFVRCSSLGELGEALERALRRGPGPDDERTFLALHEAPWGTVVGPSASLLAGPLSERFGTALSLQLDGGRLALSVRTWESGAPGEEERDPQPPHFRDVEAAAWELLQYLGVPPALRLLQLEAVEVLRQESSSALPALLARAGPDEVLAWSVSALPPPRAEGASPPAEPDEIVESRAGEARALEVRTLPGGIPTDAWAEALAAVEESQAPRLLRALSDGDEQRMPRPTFAYRSLQALRVEKLLAVARRARPWLWRLLDPEREPPLTRAGFTQACRAALGAFEVARAHGRRLEVLAPGPGPRACLRAPVDELYEVYLKSLDAEEAAAQLAARVGVLVQAPAGLLTAGHLLPALLAGEPGPRAARPLAPGLHAALLSDDGVRIEPVLETDLAALGLDFDDALARAVANLDALTDAAPEGMRWFDLDHGRVVVCDFADAGGAGRLLSPHARELLLAILGEDAALAAAPTRDALLACAASDEEGARWLADEARRRFDEGPYPVHAGLWEIGANLLQPVAGDRPGASWDGEDSE